MTMPPSIRLASLAMFGLLAIGSAVPQCAAAAAPDGPVRHEFLIRGFVTEGKAVLPEARIVYGTTGTLDAAGDNAVLLPSHYMADLPAMTG